MKVREVMTKSPACCDANTSLGAAAEIMWNCNCGFLPIVSSQQKVIGVITDRDMCFAMATRNRLPGDITVQQVAAGVVHSCFAEDEISAALATMKENKVRRLPVIDTKGTLEGVLSVDDIILRADSQGRGFLDIVSDLRKLYESQLGQVKRKVTTV